jgi:hypothetical protein
MIDDNECRQAVSELLRARAADEYSIEKMVLSVESLYREILQD